MAMNWKRNDKAMCSCGQPFSLCSGPDSHERNMEEQRRASLYRSEFRLVKGDAVMFFRPLRTGGEVRIEERLGSLVTRDYRVDLVDGRKRYASAIADGYRKA